MHFGFMDVILLHSGHQHVFNHLWPSSEWCEQEYNYNSNVSKSLPNLKIM